LLFMLRSTILILIGGRLVDGNRVSDADAFDSCVMVVAVTGFM
jgi:hypothetical protein